MREGFRHWFRVNNPLKLISVAFQLVFPIQLLTAVIASFAEDNYGEGLLLGVVLAYMCIPQ